MSLDSNVIICLENDNDEEDVWAYSEDKIRNEYIRVYAVDKITEARLRWIGYVKWKSVLHHYSFLGMLCVALISHYFVVVTALIYVFSYSNCFILIRCLSETSLSL